MKWMVLISHELKNQRSEAMNADRDLVNRLKIVIHFFVEWKQTNRSQFSAKVEKFCKSVWKTKVRINFLQNAIFYKPKCIPMSQRSSYSFIT